MPKEVRTDPFFDKQPPFAFIEDLKKPLHTKAPLGYGTRKMADDEIDVGGIYLSNRFSDDPDGLLDTVYADFENFLSVYGIGGNRYPIRFKQEPTACFEAYRVEISADGVTISADDTEGIRRGIIFLEDELRRREGAFLSEGNISRVPHIRSRITRCFFSPINRAPRFQDELSDDVDYYPEEYLNRLMHDGANGIWIYTRFSDLVPSDYIEEFGSGYESRIAKLNRTIEKCARYGIGVYLFAIEPYHLSAELAEKYPQAGGSDMVIPGKTLCMDTEFAQNHIRQASERLMTFAPKLKGFISITYGERPTSCASSYKNCNCPRCSQKPMGQVLAQAVDGLRAGFRSKAPSSETVSWTYGHRRWSFDDIREYVRNAPDDVMLMQNFDDMGYEEQLGKVRQCVDYWLSYVGPSELFEITAEEAKKAGKHLFAKMQICCSHEIASVPYIPVPGILFKKYAGAHRLGVEGVMQCWYFGNYPSLMSKAAGELAFVEDFSNEDDFLQSLAAIYWGNSNAAQVVKAWKEFEASYRQYPMNVMFSYYGPMHDGVVWKLSLKPKNYHLSRSWQTIDPVDGDRIGEAMLSGHTLDEVITLVGKMVDAWEKGVEVIKSLPDLGEDSFEQKSVVGALETLLRSGKNIVRFYKLRDCLGWQEGDNAATLQEMRELVLQEIENSRAMISLCEADGRLGYHSEGEAYKFFPAKLLDRIAQLENLLATEFVEVEGRINNGLAPLEYYLGIDNDPDIRRYTVSENGLENAEWAIIPDRKNSRFRIAREGDRLLVEMASDRKVAFKFCPEFRLFTPNPTVEFLSDGSKVFSLEMDLYFQMFGENRSAELEKYSDITVFEGEGTHLLLRLDLKKFGLTEKRPMKLRILANNVPWFHNDGQLRTLGMPEVLPADYFWVL